MVVSNCLNRHRGLEQSLRRMGDAFDGRACALPVGESGNIIGIAATGAPIDVYRAFFALRDPDGTHSGYGSVTRDITEETRAAAALAESEAVGRAGLGATPA